MNLGQFLSAFIKGTYDFGGIFDAFHDSTVTNDLQHAPVRHTLVQSAVSAVERLNVSARVFHVSVKCLKKRTKLQDGHRLRSFSSYPLTTYDKLGTPNQLAKLKVMLSPDETG